MTDPYRDTYVIGTVIREGSVEFVLNPDLRALVRINAYYYVSHYLRHSNHTNAPLPISDVNWSTYERAFSAIVRAQLEMPSYRATLIDLETLMHHVGTWGRLGSEWPLSAELAAHIIHIGADELRGETDQRQ